MSFQKKVSNEKQKVTIKEPVRKDIGYNVTPKIIRKYIRSNYLIQIINRFFNWFRTRLKELPDQEGIRALGISIINQQNYLLVGGGKEDYLC